MSEEFRSVLSSTSLLWVAMATALVLTLARPELKKVARDGDELVRWVLLLVALQCVHFVEEYLTGFDVELPALLGLARWPEGFFVPFNVGWIGIWTASAALLRPGRRAALFPIWFLAIAGAANGLAHPLLAIRAGGYFPGLLTSPLVGVAGVLLCRKLARGTRRSPAGAS